MKPWGDNFGYQARYCDKCGRSFYPKQGWEARCFPCWRVEQKTSVAYPNASRGVDPRLPDPDEWQDMLMRLVKLCHPDRHGGTQEANTVTRWLLEQRERLARRV
ncbi:MAG: hypothetical protein HQL91_11900 [Magnetococcales bacterium]|nr:hypothetical protein [Magnetococcales bacterium]